MRTTPTPTPIFQDKLTPAQEQQDDVLSDLLLVLPLPGAGLAVPLMAFLQHNLDAVVISIYRLTSVAHYLSEARDSENGLPSNCVGLL